MQSSTHEHDFPIHCAIFLLPIALREHMSISNIEHFLSRFFNVIDDIRQQ